VTQDRGVQIGYSRYLVNDADKLLRMKDLGLFSGARVDNGGGYVVDNKGLMSLFEVSGPNSPAS